MSQGRRGIQGDRDGLSKRNDKKGIAFVFLTGLSKKQDIIKIKVDKYTNFNCTQKFKYFGSQNKNQELHLH
jgi:hypothetical protein